MRQITVLNCILLVCVLAFTYFILVPIFTAEVNVPSASTAAAKGAEPEKEQAAGSVVNPPMQDYAVISEKNLFHPDRIIPVEKKEVTMPRPEFVLYGTLIVDNVRIAYLSDKKALRTTPGRGTRQVGLKVGETLSGYTLKEVLPDGAVLVRGDDRIELKVISPENKKGRDAAASGMPVMPGGTTPQPGMPIPRGPQASPPPAMMPQTPADQGSSIQKNPMPAPGTFRSRSPVGR
jgi:hypothetical protein